MERTLAKSGDPFSTSLVASSLVSTRGDTRNPDSKSMFAMAEAANPSRTFGFESSCSIMMIMSQSELARASPFTREPNIVTDTTGRPNSRRTIPNKSWGVGDISSDQPVYETSGRRSRYVGLQIYQLGCWVPQGCGLHFLSSHLLFHFPSPSLCKS